MTGPVLVAGILLVWAGVAKAWRPAGTARALSAAGLPAPPSLVRALAVAEVAIGVGAAAAGGAFAVAMACSYGAFAVFVGVALRRGWSLSSCGCFGEPDARPTVTHLLVDVALAGVSLAGGAEGLRAISSVARHPAEGAATALVAVVTAGLVVLILSVLPTVTPA